MNTIISRLSLVFIFSDPVEIVNGIHGCDSFMSLPTHEVEHFLSFSGSSLKDIIGNIVSKVKSYYYTHMNTRI